LGSDIVEVTIIKSDTGEVSGLIWKVDRVGNVDIVDKGNEAR
jgi:hypothetical protein